MSIGAWLSHHHGAGTEAGHKDVCFAEQGIEDAPVCGFLMSSSMLSLPRLSHTKYDACPYTVRS